MDLSHLDKKYFIDRFVYNCPFCKRNNVTYKMIGNFIFDWTDKKECYGYLVQCTSCQRISLHLSHADLREHGFTDAISHALNSFIEKIDIDNKIFYSRPSSFFTLDSRIPKKVRELIFQAEQSRQANLLVGASACLRKAIYELLDHQGVIVISETTRRADYQKSVKELKQKFENVGRELFDALANIQEMTSEYLHEGSWQAWDSPKLRFLVELVKTMLDEIYVIPDEKKKRLNILQQLKSTFEMNKKSAK